MQLFLNPKMFFIEHLFTNFEHILEELFETKQQLFCQTFWETVFGGTFSISPGGHFQPCRETQTRDTGSVKFAGEPGTMRKRHRPSKVERTPLGPNKFGFPNWGITSKQSLNSLNEFKLFKLSNFWPISIRSLN